MGLRRTPCRRPADVPVGRRRHRPHHPGPVRDAATVVRASRPPGPSHGTEPKPSVGPRGPSYQDILDADTRKVPVILRTTGTRDVGPTEIPTEWYLSQEVHELEVDRIWKRTWQMACREEDIPAVGDTLVYDIVGISLVLVRSAPGTVRAFYNSCLHRGRPLRDYPGRVNQLQCPYHGFTWSLDGELVSVP